MNIKETMQTIISEKRKQETNLRNAQIESESKEERAALGKTLEALAKEIADLEKVLAEMDEPVEGASADPAGEGRAFVVSKTFEARGAQQGAESNSGTNSLEYRKAFQKFMATGKMEARADATTATTGTNISTVIPENLVNKIAEVRETIGTIYGLINKTAFPVGQTIPVDGIKPVATWVGATAGTSGEGLSSDAQAKTMSASVVFAHYKLRCEVRFTEEVATMTLAAFEALFVKQVAEAMVRAKEAAVLDGTGVGMPTGILTATVKDGQAITAAELSYEALCECEGALPAEYENGAKWCMTKKTFMQIVGMTDLNGQPIARVNYGMNGKPERTVLGREVVLYSPAAASALKSYAADLAAGSLYAFIFNFGDYTLNENYNLGISHARDWDNEDHKTKAVEACDGKVIDAGSLVTLSVAAAG